MHDLAFADSARQAPVNILRLPLRPYSVGHEILLLAQRNPLVLDQGLPEDPGKARAAAIRAVLICSRTWRENQRPAKNLRLWELFLGRTDWPLAIADFKNYRAAGSIAPPPPSAEDYQIANGLQREDQDNGRELGGARLARLITFLAPIYRALDAETPFDVPFGFANFLFLCELEAQGSTTIQNSRELQVHHEMLEHRAAIAKERAELAASTRNTEQATCPPS